MSTGISVREAQLEDAPGIARVHVDSWYATYAGLIPQSYPAGLSREESKARWRERLQRNETNIVCASDDSGQVVGFAAAGPGGGETFGKRAWELYAIYLLRRWQESGLGRRLFAEALETAESGVPVITWCISANPSCGFYEVLGGDTLGTQIVEIGGTKLEETCYGWRDARELRRKLTAEC